MRSTTDRTAPPAPAMFHFAKNPGPARRVVASSATALAPFSQNSSAARSSSGSGHRATRTIESVFLIYLPKSLEGSQGTHVAECFLQSFGDGWQPCCRFLRRDFLHAVSSMREAPE